jgi:CheY-like chemotaxis protein
MAAQTDKIQERVLVADDDQSIRQLLGTIIRREGLTVDLAADGVEAIEYLKQREYPVILLDLMMPRMNGFDVVAWLKENHQSHKPVIIVITAYADQQFKQVDPDYVSGILRKPFDVSDVGSLVQACIASFQELVRGGMVATDETVRTLSPEAISQLQALRQENGNGNH